MQIKHIPARNYFCYTTQTTLSKLYDAIGNNVELLMAESVKLRLTQQGPLEFIYFDCSNDIHKEFTLEIAIPVKEYSLPATSSYNLKNFTDFKTSSYIHKGSIENLFQVYENLYQQLFKEGVQPTNQVREVYEKYIKMDSEENITEIQIGIN